jgi:hypothetical protein
VVTTVCVAYAANTHLDFLYYDRDRTFASTAYLSNREFPSSPKPGIKLNSPTATDQVNYQHDDRNHQQQMNQSTSNVTDESQQPQN